MERILTYRIAEEMNQKPIGFFLKSMGFSAGNIIALKKIPESIRLNGKWVYVREKLTPGDILTVHIKEDKISEKIPPVPLPISIVYEDEDLLIVNKPSDMPIHPSLHNYENTLGNAAAFYFASKQTSFVFRCVNRLDRDTTGLTILAKHMVSSAILSEMVAGKIIKREYLAIVEGLMPYDTGTIDAPIARLNGSAIMRCVDFEYGEHAVTHYKVVKRDIEKNLTLLLLWLETGRTHQIRVHMKYIGYPLIGDFLYHPNTAYIKRQALHSYRLTFSHPITKEAMQFTAPLPADMTFL